MKNVDLEGLRKLLETVYDIDVVRVTNKQITDKIWYLGKGNSIMSWVDKCGFVLRCKEWAWKNGYSISTSLKFGKSKIWLIEYENEDEYIDRISKDDTLACEPNVSKNLSTDTEAEGVFKACIDIMKTLKKG